MIMVHTRPNREEKSSEKDTHILIHDKVHGIRKRRYGRFEVSGMENSA